MSRCFPFPPPGYEKKLRTDLQDLLTKEKQKEKKRKKEKRDKEKEGKERKDREKDSDRSKDKHSEKKDKKEKQGDKHKKKHKHRDKDKRRILNERKVEEHKEGRNGRKVGERRFKAESTKDPELVQELGRRLRDEESGAGNQLAEITGKIQTFECMARDSSEKERSTDDKIVQNITIPERRRMGMASATEGRHVQNETLQNSICEETRRVNGTAIPMCKDADKKIERKEKTKAQRSADNKMVGFTISDQRRMGMASVMGNNSTDNETLQTSLCGEKRRVNGVGTPMHENGNKKIEGKEKTKEQEFDNRRGDIHKDRVRERIHKGKNKDREKEREKEKEKMRENGEQNKLPYIKRKEQVDPSHVINSFSPKANQKRACLDQSRKRREKNGFLHENEMRYNKLSRPAPASQLLLENGSKLVQGHVGSSCASDSHEAINMVKQDRILHKVNKINGVITAQPPAAVSAEYREAIRKPPHPDEKYLSQILHVPKMEEWPEFDDQDWLFNEDYIQQKPEAKVEAHESVLVWESALQIESADVLALPYVIPY